eukprot:1179522-Prorocentrum_minimum.AAC.1
MYWPIGGSPVVATRPAKSTPFLRKCRIRSPSLEGASDSPPGHPLNEPSGSSGDQHGGNDARAWEGASLPGQAARCRAVPRRCHHHPPRGVPIPGPVSSGPSVARCTEPSSWDHPIGQYMGIYRRVLFLLELCSWDSCISLPLVIDDHLMNPVPSLTYCTVQPVYCTVQPVQTLMVSFQMKGQPPRL